MAAGEGQAGVRLGFGLGVGLRLGMEQGDAEKGMLCEEVEEEEGGADAAEQQEEEEEQQAMAEHGEGAVAQVRDRFQNGQGREEPFLIACRRAMEENMANRSYYYGEEKRLWRCRALA